MQGQWFYGSANQQLGPVSVGELQRMFVNGTIPPQTLVWSQGMPAWVPAGTLPFLVAGVASSTNSAGLNLLLPIGPQSGYAIAAGYLGLIGLLLAPLGVLALVFGVLALREIKAHPEKRGKGRALTGIICGSISSLIMLYVLALVVAH